MKTGGNNSVTAGTGMFPILYTDGDGNKEGYIDDSQGVSNTATLKAQIDAVNTYYKKWVNQNMDNEPIDIMRKIYDNLYSYLDGKTIPEAVLIIADYQYKSAFVVDQEINMVAFLTEIMMRCTFK